MNEKDAYICCFQCNVPLEPMITPKLRRPTRDDEEGACITGYACPRCGTVIIGQ